MHTCAENIVNYFSSKASPGDHSAAENLGNNPAKLCFIVKQGVRECAVGQSNVLYSGFIILMARLN